MEPKYPSLPLAKVSGAIPAQRLPAFLSKSDLLSVGEEAAGKTATVWWRKRKPPAVLPVS
jgi:hypothetical protein